MAEAKKGNEGEPAVFEARREGSHAASRKVSFRGKLSGGGVGIAITLVLLTWEKTAYRSARASFHLVYVALKAMVESFQICTIALRSSKKNALPFDLDSVALATACAFFWLVYCLDLPVPPVALTFLVLCFLFFILFVPILVKCVSNDAIDSSVFSYQTSRRTYSLVCSRAFSRSIVRKGDPSSAGGGARAVAARPRARHLSGTAPHKRLAGEHRRAAQGGAGAPGVSTSTILFCSASSMEFVVSCVFSLIFSKSSFLCSFCNALAPSRPQVASNEMPPRWRARFVLMR